MTGTKAALITGRDCYLLRELAAARVLDREQIKVVAGFGATSTVNARLLKLCNAGLLNRFFTATQSGGMKALYAISAKGAQLAEVPTRPLQRKANSVLVGDLFVEHQLSINNVWLAVKYLNPKDMQFIRWLQFPSVISKAIPLSPDGYFEVRTASGIHSLFCEVDRGTESLRIWSKKIELYLALAATGEFEKLFKQVRFKVLVVATSQRRLDTIRRTVAKQTGKIFRFSTFESINRDGLFAAIWNLPEGNERQSPV